MHWKQVGPTITSEVDKKELFLVEGKSAESTIRQAMNRATQEVFALQGKLLNANSLSEEKICENAVCAALFATLGCGTGSVCDPSQLQFSRVILLTDPDVDGAHARALLALLFMKLLRPLVEAQKVLAVIPPLWRVDGAGAPVYAWTDDELKQVRADVLPAGNDASLTSADLPASAPVTRFRGVAQFNRGECVSLLLDPATRRQVLLSLS